MRLVIRWRSRRRGAETGLADTEEPCPRVAGPVLATPEMASELTVTDPVPRAPVVAIREEVTPVIVPMLAAPAGFAATATAGGSSPSPAPGETVRKMAQETSVEPGESGGGREDESPVKPRCRSCGSTDLWKWGRTKGWRLAVANVLGKHWEQCRACGLRQMLPGPEGPPPDPIADLVRKRREDESAE